MACYLRTLPRIKNNISFIFNRFSKYGGKGYDISEPTTILKHSILSAKYMENNLCSSKIAITSALLHDFGHLSESEPIDPKHGVDDRHEWVGAMELKRLGFPAEVYMPISYHVKAKQYLVSKNKKYFESLSDGSKLSLKLQGGMMSQTEILEFENKKWFDASILLRIADDNGKLIDNYDTEIFDHNNKIVKDLIGEYMPPLYQESNDITQFHDDIESVLVNEFTPFGWKYQNLTKLK